MNNFENFVDWCQYWSNEFQIHGNSWVERTSIGMDTDSYVDQYICKISFDSIQNARAAHCDVHTYGADYGYGHPYDCIDDSNHEEYWDVYMQCPDLPLVIRMANNHGGRIVWWNSQILQEPKVNIPFYIPAKPKEKKGCYVATAIYGSYDCPEVWTLRRFRDNTMSSFWYGRLFIKIYYKLSPSLIKIGGNSSFFKDFGKSLLDKLVQKLNQKGYKNTPYVDK